MSSRKESGVDAYVTQFKVLVTGPSPFAIENELTDLAEKLEGVVGSGIMPSEAVIERAVAEPEGPTAWKARATFSVDISPWVGYDPEVEGQALKAQMVNMIHQGRDNRYIATSLRVSTDFVSMVRHDMREAGELG
jgi:hypothetical protein